MQLPHNAQLQYNAVPHIRDDQLQPGDVVWFAQTYPSFEWITHDGIYIGNGLQLNAPTDGQVVSVQPVFSGFWDSDRLVTRRVRGIAALDPDFEQVVRARDEWRRHGLRVLVGRIAEQHGRPAPETLDEAVNILYTLIGFECFDTLAGPARSIEEVAPVVRRLAHAALGLSEG